MPRGSVHFVATPGSRNYIAWKPFIPHLRVTAPLDSEKAQMKTISWFSILLTNQPISQVHSLVEEKRLV